MRLTFSATTRPCVWTLTGIRATTAWPTSSTRSLMFTQPSISGSLVAQSETTRVLSSSPTLNSQVISREKCLRSRRWRWVTKAYQFKAWRLSTLTATRWKTKSTSPPYSRPMLRLRILSSSGIAGRFNHLICGLSSMRRPPASRSK